MKIKQFSPSRVKIKDAATGEIEAVFATIGVKDHDGDIIMSGAIDDGATVAVSAYGHSVWKGDAPAGVGTIHEEGDELILKGRYFLDTDQGRNDFHTVKGLAEAGKGEWSFGLLDIVATKGEFNGVEGNLIKSVNVPEVSPVFIGAGINTRTLVAKGRKEWDSTVREGLRTAGTERFGDDDVHVWVQDYDPDEGVAVFEVYGGDQDRYVQVDYTIEDDDIVLGSDETEVERRTSYAPKTGVKFSEHLASVLSDVKALTTRASEVVALRAAKGKTISDDASEALCGIADQLDRIKTLIEQPTPPNESSDEAEQEYLRFVALTSRMEP